MPCDIACLPLRLLGEYWGTYVFLFFFFFGDNVDKTSHGRIVDFGEANDYWMEISRRQDFSPRLYTNTFRSLLHDFHTLTGPDPTFDSLFRVAATAAAAATASSDRLPLPSFERLPKGDAIASFFPSWNAMICAGFTVTCQRLRSGHVVVHCSAHAIAYSQLVNNNICNFARRSLM